MTIIVILVGILVSHLLTGLGRWRNFSWLLWPVRQLRDRFPDWAWLPMAVVMVVSLLTAMLAIWLMTAMLGVVGWVLLALVVFIYTAGPRDLDHDVGCLLDREESDDHSEVESTAWAMQLSLDDGAEESAAAVFHGALSRWFGVIFWFAVLGIPGALLYRLNRKALQMDELERDEIEWLARLRIVLDWPVLALMGVSMGLCGDLDRVYRAWQKQREHRPAWIITPSLLDRIATAIVPADADFDGGLMAAHRMVWRMLVLWLVVMSLLLLAGWLV